MWVKKKIEKERKSERKREKENGITSPGSSLSPPDEMSWTCLGITFLWMDFPCQDRLLAFCTILEMGWRAWGSLVVLIRLPLPVCTHFSASSLHCTGLCFPPGTRTRKGAVLPLHGPLLQPHLVLSPSMLIPTILGYYQQFLSVATKNPWLHSQWVFGAYTLAPYLLGFHSRVHGNTSAPAFSNKAANLLPCHEKVIPDTFSPTV